MKNFITKQIKIDRFDMINITYLFYGKEKHLTIPYSIIRSIKENGQTGEWNINPETLSRLLGDEPEQS